MQIEKKTLLDNLTKITSAIKGALLLSPTHIYSVNGVEGVASFRLDIGVEGVIKIDGSKLLSILKKMPDDTIDVSYNKEKGEVLVKKGKSRYGFKIIEGTYTIPNSENNTKLKEFDKDSFALAVGMTSSIMVKKFTSAFTPFVHYNGKCKRLEATDRRKLLLYNVDLGDENFLVSDVVFNSSLKTKPDTIGVSSKWVTLSDGVVTTMIMNCASSNTYPDFTPFIEKMELESKSKVVFPPNLEEMLSRVGAFGLDLNSYFEFKIEDGVMSLSGNSESAWFEDKEDVGNSEDVCFKVNSVILSNALYLGGTAEKFENKITIKGTDWIYMTSLAETETKNERTEIKVPPPDVETPVIEVVDETTDVPFDADETSVPEVEESDEWN
jgi:hypothetical protein